MKKTQGFALDNASSVPIVLSRRKRGKVGRASKPYEVEYRGVVIRCSTPQEAAAVAKELGESPESPDYATWQPHEFLDFVHRVQWQQRCLLNYMLKARYNRAKDKELQVELGLMNNQALAGVLSGITKVAQAMDIDPRRIYWQRTEYRQGQPHREYHLAQGFVKAATDNEWPGEHDLDVPQDS